MVALEDFLAKAGAAEEEEAAAVKVEAAEGLSGGVFTFDPMAMSPFPSERVVDGVVGFGNGVEVVGRRGKRRAALESLDKAAQQRQRRMIKNRESAARSTEKKQSHSRTKHASNDPRGQDTNPAEPEMVFKPQLFKNMEIQKTWLPKFKEKPIITGREFEKSFPHKYYKKMLAPMEALGWDGFRPLPTDVYSNLVRFFYCNLEIRNLDNIEYTIDTKVRGKDIVLNPTILSEITGIANTGDCIFISKPSQLDKYVSKKHMNEVIAKKGAIGVTQTKELKKEFRLFHRYIAHNLIPKKGHYNQVTNMDAFIIYRAAIKKSLNLNYIILKEMADVRNHSSRALPYGALLTKVFKHFRVKFNRQLNKYIDKGFSIITIKRGINIDSTEGEEEEEEEEESNRQNMEVEGNFEDPPPQTKETHERPSTQVLQLQLQEEDTMHDEQPMHGEDPMQEGPSAWFMEYFGKINETMERMEQRQEEQAKYLEQIIQHQEKQERYIDRLNDLYENLYEQQIDFNQRYHDRIADVETQLECLLFSTHPPPPPADYPPPSPPPPFDVPSSSHQPSLPPSTSYRPSLPSSSSYRPPMPPCLIDDAPKGRRRRTLSF